MVCILLWSFAVRVHGSQAYRKMDVTRECISRILELREILLSFQTGFNFVNAAVVCAILGSISGLGPSLPLQKSWERQDSVTCIGAQSSKLPSWVLLPWWPHLMNIFWGMVHAHFVTFPGSLFKKWVPVWEYCGLNWQRKFTPLGETEESLL